MNIALVSYIGEGYGVTILVCYTTVFSVVTQGSSRYTAVAVKYSVNIACVVSNKGERGQKNRSCAPLDKTAMLRRRSVNIALGLTHWWGELLDDISLLHSGF